MNREIHVRICEGLRGKFPRLTRLAGLAKYIEIKISAMENMLQFFKLTICNETGNKSLNQVRKHGYAQ